MIQINQNQKKKIPDTSGLVKKTNYDAKIADIEGKIPDLNNLATKTALTSVENKMPSVSSLVKKKQIMTLKLQKLRISLITIIMMNILLLQNLILQLLLFIMQDYHREVQCEKQILMLNYQVLTKGLLQIKQNTYTFFL